MVEKLVLVIDQAKDAGANGGENLGWAEAIGPVDIALVFDQLFKGGDANFEKLVEVRADDGKEFEAFEEGLGGILGFLKDALIKLEPTELAIEVRGGVERHE